MRHHLLLSGLLVLTITGCGTSAKDMQTIKTMQSEVAALRAQVQLLQQSGSEVAAQQALATAAAAQQAADNAVGIATDAHSTAAANTERLDRMFRKSMYK